MRENGIFVARSLIGSRPPRCERRCSNCGHCKAVQVPIAPKLRISSLQQQTTISSKIHHFYAAYSRGDDISNYKPMCWKCQCGDSFFNPWIIITYKKKLKNGKWKKWFCWEENKISSIVHMSYIYESNFSFMCCFLNAAFCISKIIAFV